MKRNALILLCLVSCNIVAAQSPYTLQQLKDSALRNNIAMRQARIDIDAAREQRREAFTKYFPTVSATGAWFNANRPMAKMDVDPQEFITPETGMMLSQMLPPEMLATLGTPMSMTMMKNGTIASLTAMQPVFAGGQIVNGNRLARVGEEASQLQMQLRRNEVERQVEQYYWQLVSLQEKVKTIDAVDSLLARIYKDVEVAVRAGVAMRNDLLQVQLRQNDIASERLKLQNGISIVKMLLSQYCGIEPNPTPSPRERSYNSLEVIMPDIDQQSSKLPSLGEGLGVGLLPEYQLLEKQVEATALQKKMAIGQQMPTVAVGAGYNYHNLLENDRTFGMLFATVSIPISDWWGGSHAIKRKKLEHQKALDQLADNAQLLEIRAQKAANDVAEARQQLDLASRAIEQADENLRILRNQYKAGVSNMSDLLEAQLLYQQTLDKRVDAWANLQNRLLDLRQATGQE
ncbi:MAG: TolC family protein [Prevotella sp.]|nr:TolC family protein [Prevotella sp.]